MCLQFWSLAQSPDFQHSSIGGCAFSCLGTKLWNSLPKPLSLFLLSHCLKFHSLFSPSAPTLSLLVQNLSYRCIWIFFIPHTTTTTTTVWLGCKRYGTILMGWWIWDTSQPWFDWKEKKVEGSKGLFCIVLFCEGFIGEMVSVPAL